MKDSLRKIVECEIRPSTGRFNLPDVMVRYEGSEEGTELELLLDYYPDELSFTPEEFVGLTRDEAFEMKQAKDVIFIRS
jgi:hypothetical protein